MLFKYDGNIRRILWNCSSPEAKFRSSDCCARAGTENRQARKQAINTRSILVLLPVATEFTSLLKTFPCGRRNPYGRLPNLEMSRPRSRKCSEIRRAVGFQAITLRPDP